MSTNKVDINAVNARNAARIKSINLPYHLKSVSDVRLSAELEDMLGTKDFKIVCRLQQIVMVDCAK